MNAWAERTIATALQGASRALAAAPTPPSGSRAEARTLLGVLTIIIALLVILIVLVAFSFLHRRIRAATGERAAARGSTGRTRTRRVDAWAEAGRRAVLASPPPPDTDDHDQDSASSTDDRP